MLSSYIFYVTAYTAEMTTCGVSIQYLRMELISHDDLPVVLKPQTTVRRPQMHAAALRHRLIYLNQLSQCLSPLGSLQDQPMKCSQRYVSAGSCRSGDLVISLSAVLLEMLIGGKNNECSNNTTHFFNLYESFQIDSFATAETLINCGPSWLRVLPSPSLV